MVKKCVICKDNLYENNGKLKGTILKVRNEKGINELIYVCSDCQKKFKTKEEILNNIE